MQLFSMEGKLYHYMERFWDLVKLNFIWIIFSLPIVTIGASTVAAYTVTLKMVENKEESVIRDFIKSFRENWKQGIPLGLIHLIVIYSFSLNLELLAKYEETPVLFFIVALSIGFLGLLCLTYSLPLSARYQNSFLGTLVNSVTIAMKFFMTTLLLWIVVGVIIYMFMTKVFLMILGIIVGPGLIFFIVSKFSMRIFKSIEKENIK